MRPLRGGSPLASSIPTAFRLSRQPSTYGHTSAVGQAAGWPMSMLDDGVWANMTRLGRPAVRLRARYGLVLRQGG